MKEVKVDIQKAIAKIEYCADNYWYEENCGDGYDYVMPSPQCFDKAKDFIRGIAPYLSDKVAIPSAHPSPADGIWISWIRSQPGNRVTLVVREERTNVMLLDGPGSDTMGPLVYDFTDEIYRKIAADINLMYSGEWVDGIAEQHKARKLGK